MIIRGAAKNVDILNKDEKSGVLNLLFDLYLKIKGRTTMSNYRNFILLIFVFSFAANARAISVSKCFKTMTVEEAFSSLSSDQLPITDDDKGPIVDPKVRRKQIALRDLKNGYLKLQSKTIISETVIVLFRLTGGNPLLIVTADGPSVQKVYAFECANNVWVDKIGRYLPDITLENLELLYKKAGAKQTAKDLGMVAHSKVRYQLPRVGKKLKIFAGHPDYENLLLEERLFNGVDFLPVK